MHSAEHRAFAAAALAWSKSGNERHIARMLRSPLSRVPQDVGAAYATLAQREPSLVQLLAEQTVAASDARDGVIRFSQTIRDLRGLAEPAARELIDERFGLGSRGSLDDTIPGGPFALAAAAEAEPARPLRAHQARFSASQLNAYVECGRKWYYRYLCGAVEDKGSSASFYGTAFHGALEAFHGEYPRPGDADAAELQRKLEGYLNAAFDRFRGKFETPVEYELQRRRAARTGRKYVEWLVAEAKRAPFSVVGCEVPADLDLDGFAFVGYIDRLDRDTTTGATAVIDYKTGSIAATAAEYREKVRAFKDFQLPFYYWARTALGDRVTKLALVPLKDALLDVRPISLEVVPVPVEVGRAASATGVIPLSELERARERMVELCRQLATGEGASFAPTGDPSSCRYCAYALGCIGRPYPAEERFAR